MLSPKMYESFAIPFFFFCVTVQCVLTRTVMCVRTHRASTPSPAAIEFIEIKKKKVRKRIVVGRVYYDSTYIVHSRHLWP